MGTIRLTSSCVSVSPEPGAADRYLSGQGYGDGLPLVAPTRELVLEFVTASGREPSEVVAAIPPRRGVATVEKVAINAAMAGCEPSHMPALIAVTRAVTDPGFNARIIQATSNPAGTLILINGPVRDQIGINSGANCMGQGTRPNLTIGRALRLILTNIGGGIPGSVDKACHGYPGKISFCFGEAEEDSPWAPLHVDRGYKKQESVVTVAAAHGTTNIVLHGRAIPEDLLPELSHGMISAGASNFAQGSFGNPVLVLTPSTANALAASGVTKETTQRYLFEHARVPIAWYPPHARRSGDLEEKAKDGRVPITTSADQIIIVVAGSPGTHATFIPTYADSVATSWKV